MKERKINVKIKQGNWQIIAPANTVFRLDNLRTRYGLTTNRTLFTNTRLKP